MNELHEQIRQTILALNQENAQPVVEEMQSHLSCLLDMVRDELQQRLKERSWSEPSIGITEQSEAPYKSVRIDYGDKQPLTAEELKAGGWWCADISQDAARSFSAAGLLVYNGSQWGNKNNAGHNGCLFGDDSVVRDIDLCDNGLLKQIHRINDQFFWSDEK